MRTREIPVPQIIRAPFKSDVYFLLLQLAGLPHSLGWEAATCLKIQACAKQLGSGVAPCSSAVLADPFCLPLPLLILSFYFQPAFEYNTEESCAVNTDEHPWVYLHINTFIWF